MVVTEHCEINSVHPKPVVIKLTTTYDITEIFVESGVNATQTRRVDPIFNSPRQELYCRHRELVERYEISISHMKMDLFTFMQMFLSYITENTVTKHCFISNTMDL